MQNPIQRILAIETSCDDTSVAIVDAVGRVISLCSAHQDLAHAPFGGIVPEIASRNHTLHLLPLVEQCLREAKLSWDDVNGIAVTSRPGLVGSLLVGVVSAKTLAMLYDLPFIGINHIEGHLLAPFLRDSEYHPPEHFYFPYLALAISGGHTHLFEVQDVGSYKLLGHTVDDAAGEAFDKFAKMIGLGYPGGVQIDKHGAKGHPRSYDFPRGMIKEDNLDFSFSGLKTAGQRLINSLTPEEKRERLDDLCASYQEAIVDVLIAKLDRAVVQRRLKNIALTGGVSANSRLRAKAKEWAEERGITLVIPPPRYCTDNAAMIGYAGICRLRRGERSAQDLGPSPSALPDDYQKEL